MAILSGPYGPWPGNKRPVEAQDLGLMTTPPPEAMQAASMGAVQGGGILGQPQEQQPEMANSILQMIPRMKNISPEMIFQALQLLQQRQGG